jgi:hypothetical protein
MAGAVVWALFTARHWAIAHLATDEAVSEWQAWRNDVRRGQTEPGPVARRVPKSAEPPGLVLMRDYFFVCLVGALFFTTLLYWILVWFIIGMLRTPSSYQPEAQATDSPGQASR